MDNPSPSAPVSTSGTHQSLLPLLLLTTTILGAFIGYLSRPYLDNFLKTSPATSDQEQSTDTGRPVLPSSAANQPARTTENLQEPPFCQSYGTSEVAKSDLLQTHKVGPGETLRQIARAQLGDETKAADLITANPQLVIYEIDDELPMNLPIFLPNAKYSQTGITSYTVSKGNIAYNPDKPMFGIDAPNSGTGPFIIPENLKDTISAIPEGQCVEVIYGSRGYDPQKIVLDIRIQ